MNIELRKKIYLDYLGFTIDVKSRNKKDRWSRDVHILKDSSGKIIASDYSKSKIYEMLPAIEEDLNIACSVLRVKGCSFRVVASEIIKGSYFVELVWLDTSGGIFEFKPIESELIEAECLAEAICIMWIKRVEEEIYG